jgi:hypothetical protein
MYGSGKRKAWSDGGWHSVASGIDAAMAEHGPPFSLSLFMCLRKKLKENIA